MSRARQKRKRQPAFPDLGEFGLEDLLDSLQQHGPDLAAAAILELTRPAGLTLTELKKHKAGAPAFASASWKDVAKQFNLDPSKDLYQLGTFSFPVASLPPSFHREVMKVSAKWLDVYQERGAHDREAARVRLMDAVRASLICRATTNSFYLVARSCLCAIQRSPCRPAGVFYA
jgi:hypothetical protein